MPGGSVRLREACRVLSTGSGAPDRSSRTFHFLPQCSFDGRSIWRGGPQRDAAHHRQAVSFDTGPLPLSDPGLIVGREAAEDLGRGDVLGSVCDQVSEAVSVANYRPPPLAV